MREKIMANTITENQPGGQHNPVRQHSISDATVPEELETDPNGAQTAVGVPHPENRLPEDPNFQGRNIQMPELDDYDDDQNMPDNGTMPYDSDPGRSYPGLTDVGEIDSSGVTDGDEEYDATFAPPQSVDASSDLL